MTDVVQYRGTHGSTPRGSENTQDSPGHPLAGRFLLLGICSPLDTMPEPAAVKGERAIYRTMMGCNREFCLCLGRER